MTEEVVDDTMVEILPTEMGITSGRQHFVDLECSHQHLEMYFVGTWYKHGILLFRS